MKKRTHDIFGLLLLGLLAFAAIWVAQYKKTNEDAGRSTRLQQRVAGRFEQEFLMTRDPAINAVPRERLLKAYAKAQEKRAEMAFKDSAIPIYWEERGPNNVGGRTRGLILDASDPTWRTVWAAGVSGGLWRTTNIDAPAPTWTLINDFFENLNITTIAQDPSNLNRLYFGTGEQGFAFGIERGMGIWRSEDGGTNWTLLPSTLPSTMNPNFNNVNKIVVDNAGTVYAATTRGLFRSTDNGNSWTEILGAGNGAIQDNVQDFEIAANGDFYAGVRSDGIYRFRAGAWGKLTTDLPTLGNYGRVELACAPNDANVLYAAFEDLTQTDGTNPCLTIVHSTNGGDNWTPRTVPALGPFCWYALVLAVDPNNSNRVWAGDVSLFVSGDAGVMWTGIGGVHVDHHVIVYRPGNSDEVIFGNDGGVYRSTNGSAAVPTLIPRNDGYNVTQFYANTLHPNSGSNYMLGGTQDNGTQRFTLPGLSSTDEPTGNDGAFCFIDRDDPNIQITGSQNRQFFISTNGGTSFGNLLGEKNGTLFITPAEYDDTNDILYISESRDTLGRISDIGGANTLTFERITQLNNTRISALTISPNTANRLFIASETGRFLRVDNADQAGAITVTTLTRPVNGFISCIVVENGDDNHIIVTCSNFGTNSVLESTDGGVTWVDLDDDLPDMPVRWAMFHPFDNTKFILATEIGVWSTDQLDGTNTQWWPTNNFGLANVRVDMLRYRSSDHLVAAATHGRGMYTTDYFTLLNTCVANLNVPGAIAPGIYMARDVVSSDGTISPGTKVIFHAGEYVSLTPNFWAQAGSDFWALILACGIGPKQPDEQEKRTASSAAMRENNPLAASGKLHLRCYPNPTTYRLLVEYDLPSDGTYSLYVRSLQGRLMETFAADDFRMAGQYTLSLNALNYSAGVYVLTLQTANSAVSERFVVAK
ncbi:MAG: T9SS type A sorting domain-containing protein [Saprospiraceae bacterium]|nr:T9SS type A sorting domain-containing protein [Saprospiraceae bacterium]